MNYSGIPKIEHFTARDREQLDYRFYPSNSDKLIILLHGSGLNSQSFFKMADNLSGQNVAKVITPDLRGHGEYPKKRGDIDYIGQFDDDLVDLIRFSQDKYSPSKIFIGGHSSGGGLALRIAGSIHQNLVDGFVFLAPYLKYNAPTINENADYAEVNLGRAIALSLLNKIGIHVLDHLVTVNFNIPNEHKDGTKTVKYTHAAITSIMPNDYKKDFASLYKPALLLIGENDEEMVASAFPSVIPKTKTFELCIIPKINHIDVILDQQAIQTMILWLNEH